jgi:signal transduction histidine kinase
MNPLTRPAALAKRIVPALWSRASWLYVLVGPVGLITGVTILVLLGVGFILTWWNVAAIKLAGQALMQIHFSDIKADDSDLKLNINDYAYIWSKNPNLRTHPVQGVRAVLDRVGKEVAHRNKAPRREPASLSGVVKILRIELAQRGGAIEAIWEMPSEGLPSQGPPHRGRLEHVSLGPSTGHATYEANVNFEIDRTVPSKISNALISYTRLHNSTYIIFIFIGLIALLGGFGMAVQLQRYWTIKADDAVDKAALNFANQMSHELGNIVGAITFNLRGVRGLLDLADSFTEEGYAAAEAAASRAGLEPEQARRYLRALRREFASRGMDPDVEWRGDTALARSACRDVDVCVRYLALGVKELEGHLHQAPQEVRPEAIPLGPCLDDAMTLLAPRLDATSTRVDRDEASGRVRVQADWRLLVPALVNVIKNAIESASHTGTVPQIQITAREGEGIVHLTVADNGPGFSADGLARAFQLGYSTKGAGRGRGLAIVREMLAAQEGEVRVANRAGGGAEVLISLPSPPDE